MKKDIRAYGYEELKAEMQGAWRETIPGGTDL